GQSDLAYGFARSCAGASNARIHGESLTIEGSCVAESMDLSYILNHLGEEREGYHGAVSPPIVQSSIFAFPSVDEMRAGFRDEFAQHMYTRGNNPTVAILRKKVAALEGAEDCLVFGSGAAAMSAGICSFVGAGDHVLCV